MPSIILFVMLLTQLKLLYVKARIEPKPSRVLHFRGVPLDVTDSEILQLSLPFGNVTNLVVSKKKNQVVSPTNTHISDISSVYICPYVCTLPTTKRWLGGVVAACWTRDPEVSSSTPGRGIVGQRPWASCSHQCASVYQAV